MKSLILLSFLWFYSVGAYALSDCAGSVRFDNQSPEGRVIEDFIVSARDAVLGMSYVSIMKVFGQTQLEALRYQDCESPWSEGSRVETICKIPKLAAGQFKYFPPYIGFVREGDRTEPGRAAIYFLDRPSLIGADSIGSIYCEAF